MKQTLLKASIVISVIVIVMSYFELFRYINMYIKSPESFTSYQNLERAGTGRVVVLTEGFVSKPYLNSLLDQTVKVDEIACNGECSDCVKKFMNNYETSYPLQTTLKRERDSKTKIVILKGDVVYCPELIEELVNASTRYDNAIIYGNKKDGVEGGILITSNELSPEVVNDKDTNIEKLIDKYGIVDEVDLKINRNYMCLGMFT